MSTPFTFIRKASTSSMWHHCATANPSDGSMVRVESFTHSGTVDLDWSHGPLVAKMRFTAAEARAVAAELLACADAMDAAACRQQLVEG